MSLRRAFAVWLKKVLCRPGYPVLADLNEVKTMLAERVMKWAWQGKAQGMQEGIVKGREEGRKRGEAAMLAKMLELKFGHLPKWI
ncbi:MAG: hypothetical protein P8163_20345 [Candidatus Thiodiazotropha sp.]